MARAVVTNEEALKALGQIIATDPVETVFAIPHFNPHVGDVDGKGKIEIRYLRECLRSLSKQVDADGNPETRFAVVVVNDASPAYQEQKDASTGELDNANELRALFEQTIQDFAGRIKIIAIEQDVNGGIGNARNPVIDLADKLGIPSVSFLDHDDQAAPERVSKTIAAFGDPNVDLVYSAFRPIDKDGEFLENDALEVGVRKYLELITDPDATQEGPHKWRDLFLAHDYYNLPSTTSVRTSLMAQHLFTRPLCEDNSIWPVLMAYGGEIKFLDTVAPYRVLPKGETASRAANGDFFDVAYVSADLEGLDGAVKAAEARGFLTPADRDVIFSVFMERSIAYNNSKPNGKSRPDIAVTLRDLCEGRLSFEDALDIERFCARVNYNALEMRKTLAKEMTAASGLTKANATRDDWNELRARIQDKFAELGIVATPIPGRIQTELDREKAGEPITYSLVTGTGLEFDSVPDTPQELQGPQVGSTPMLPFTPRPGVAPEAIALERPFGPDAQGQIPNN